MYVDDVYYSTLTGSIFDLLDVERIEILRGPQGTLAGQNSIGGAVKLYSKRPDGDGGGHLEVKYGSYNHTEVRASGDFTVAPDKLFVRIAGVSNHADGFVTRYDYRCTHPTATTVPSYVSGTSCTLGTEGGKAYDAVRASVRWTPTEKLDVNLIFDTTHDRSEASALTLLYVGSSAAPGTGPGINQIPNIAPPIAALPPGGGSPNQSIGSVPFGTATGSAFISHSPFGAWAQDSFSHSAYTNYSTYTDPRPVDGSAPWTAPSQNQVNGSGFSGSIDYDVADNLKLKYIGAYRKYTAEWSVDEDGSPIGLALLHNQVRHWQQSHELRLSGDFRGKVYYTVGGLYFDQKTNYNGRIELPGFAFIEKDTVPASTKGIFANADWKVTDKLSLIVGARHTEMEKQFIFGRLGVPGNTYPSGASPQVSPLNGTIGRAKNDRNDYRAVVQYQLTDSIMTYAQVATGFKGAGVNPRPFFVQQELPFDPESLKAYEVGLKTNLFDHRVRLNGSAFFNDYSDILITVANCTAQAGAGFGVPCSLPLNAGDAEVKGVELEGEAHPFAGLSIDGSFSVLDFKYKKLLPSALASGITYAMRTPFSPKLKYSLGVQYEIPLGSAGSLTPRLDYSYQSTMYSQPLNSGFTRVEGYGLLDGRIAWRAADGDWQVALEVSNMTDKLYYLSVFDNRGSTRDVLGAPGMPRTYTFSIQRNF
jgi:iron complex outermembrane receptor protein